MHTCIICEHKIISNEVGKIKLALGEDLLVISMK